MKDKLFSSGLLTPFLQTEQGVRLAARVISAVPPSKLPNTTLELKCFDEMISRVATAAVPTHLKVKCALAAWPLAGHLEKESCFAQAQMFGEGVQIGDYQFITAKDFDSLLSIDYHGRYFHHVANGCTVFKVSSIKNPLSAAILLMVYLPNLARPLDPFNWFFCGLYALPNAVAQKELRRAADSMIRFANDIFRPY